LLGLGETGKNPKLHGYRCSKDTKVLFNFHF